jgi:lipopolysaccharide/colanic/teichoic acid biosynthesis glycosyltransferase
MPYIERDLVDEKTRKRLDELIDESKSSYWKLKRCFDLVLVIFILLFFLPLMALVALVVWLENPKVSPVYVQTRVGRHGKEFKMYKFRTMIPNADKMKDSLMSQNEMAGPVFKIKDDPRITKVGKILRVTSLDELMQFFNVLKGDMSLVGPRPPLPREVKEYTDYQRLRLLATPGLTCTWQISKNRNDIPFDQWVEMDLEYIDKRSFLTDIAIILKTPIAMLSATGQ